MSWPSCERSELPDLQQLQDRFARGLRDAGGIGALPSLAQYDALVEAA